MGGMHPNTPYLFTMNIPDGQYLEWIVIILSDEITSPFPEHGSKLIDHINVINTDFRLEM